MKTLGLVPMVLSREEAASMWRSLGLTILFGTISGTLLTLLIVPVGYITMDAITTRMNVIVPRIAGAARTFIAVTASRLFVQLQQRWQLVFNKDGTTGRIDGE
jgi:hypothetical protein